MTDSDQSEITERSCEVCQNEPMVGVAAVPGAPVSLAYGRNCLEHNATPAWIAEFNVGQCVPFDDMRWDHLAEWFREQEVFVGGEYRRMDALTLTEGPCKDCDGKGEIAEGGLSVEYADGATSENACPMCFKGRVVRIAELAA